MKFFNSHIFLVGITTFHVVFTEIKAINQEHGVENTFVKMLKNIIKANERRMEALKKITALQDYVITQTRTQFEESEESLESDTSPIISYLDMTNNRTFFRTRKSNEQSKTKKRPVNKITVLPVVLDNNSIKNNLDKYHLEIRNNHGKSKVFPTYRKENVKVIAGKKKTDEKKEYNDEVNLEMSDDEEKVGVTMNEPRINVSIEDFRRGWMNSCKRKAARVCKSACVEAHRNFCRVFSCSRRAKKRFRKECKLSCRSKFKSDSRYSDTE